MVARAALSQEENNPPGNFGLTHERKIDHK